MNGPVVVAVAIVTGLATIAAATWWAAERAEAKARAVINTTCVCSACQQTPVTLPGEHCAACRHRATYHICPVCETQRVPMPKAPCAICLHEFHAEMDRWEATP